MTEEIAEEEKEKNLDWKGLNERAIRSLGAKDQKITQDMIDYASKEFSELMKVRTSEAYGYAKKYVNKPQNVILHFGKHSGESFEEIYENDRSYWNWLLREFDDKMQAINFVLRDARGYFDENRDKTLLI